MKLRSRRSRHEPPITRFTARSRGAILADMWGVLLFLLVAWIVISILGAVIKGLLFLTFIGVILFVLTALYGWSRRSRR